MSEQAAAVFYRCLPDYQQRCDCTLADLMLGRDCGVEIPSPDEPTPHALPAGGAP